MWVEINGRINYPIKNVLIEMVENQEVNMEDGGVKFCVSWYGIQVSQVGTETFVAGWNEHRITGK